MTALQSLPILAQICSFQNANHHCKDTMAFSSVLNHFLIDMFLVTVLMTITMVLRILIQDMVFGIQMGIKRSDWLSRPGNEHQKFNTVEIVFLLMALSTVLINLPACLPSNVSSSLNCIGHCQPSICSCSTHCRIKKGVRVAK
jgi:hypothetical protein